MLDNSRIFKVFRSKITHNAKPYLYRYTEIATVDHIIRYFKILRATALV